MKVFYWGSFFFTDSDFCIVKHLQDKGIDVTYFIPVEKGRTRGALLDIRTQYNKTGIFPASIYKEFGAFKDYIDLSKIYVVNSINKSPFHIANLFLRIKLLIRYLSLSPDVFHTSVPLSRTFWFLYYLGGKRVITLHDPIPHSGQNNAITERLRKKAILKCDKIVILSKDKLKQFLDTYECTPQKVFISKLGYFDYLSILNFQKVNIDSKYILFFGQIFSYKGIEYLLEAMVKVHAIHPKIKLVVAGGGEMYFDITPYKDKDYIIIENRFIELPKLIGLLKDCMFSVAPYKDATQSGILINAFSLNVPMVVTNVGFFPEMVKDGETGLIVDPQNVDQLADAIIKLIDSPELLSKMRRNIETKWRSSMGWDIIADDLVNVYKRRK